MADLKFKPVPHNHPEFIARAKLRPGFSEAYEGLELEYALAGQMLGEGAKAGLSEYPTVKKDKEV
jgi:hypothetical protein